MGALITAYSAHTSKSLLLYQPGKKCLYLVQYKPWYEISELTHTVGLAVHRKRGGL